MSATVKPSEAMSMDYIAVGQHGVFAIMAGDVAASEVRSFKAMAKKHSATVERATRADACDRHIAYISKMQKARSAYDAALAEAEGR